MPDSSWGSGWGSVAMYKSAFKFSRYFVCLPIFFVILEGKRGEGGNCFVRFLLVASLVQPYSAAICRQWKSTGSLLLDIFILFQCQWPLFSIMKQWSEMICLIWGPSLRSLTPSLPFFLPFIGKRKRTTSRVPVSNYGFFLWIPKGVRRPEKKEAICQSSRYWVSRLFSIRWKHRFFEGWSWDGTEERYKYPEQRDFRTSRPNALRHTSAVIWFIVFIVSVKKFKYILGSPCPRFQENNLVCFENEKS